MNRIDIAAQGVVVAPEFLAEIREGAWDGTVSVERIYGLAFAITTALDAVANEAMSRQGQAEAGPITNMREWAVIASLMDLLKEQADACGTFFEKAELAAARVTRDHRSGVTGMRSGMGEAA